jgi:hypothetical protein
MKNTLAILTLACQIAIAQQASTGAKALFLDSQTGVAAVPSTIKSSAKPAAAHNARQVPAVTGVMYYLELMQLNGELVRVSTNRTFHSGDKVRLHVTPNVDGDLLILQSQDRGAFEQLFPSQGNQMTSGRVMKGTETILPGRNGWFEFDQNPGDIRLLLMLRSDTAPASDNSTIGANRFPQAPAQQAEVIRRSTAQQRGSKALKIEMDDSPSQAAEYRVIDSRVDRSVKPGEIAIEIDLAHRAQ